MYCVMLYGMLFVLVCVCAHGFMCLCVLCAIYCAMLYGLRFCVCLCLCAFMCQCDVLVIYCVLLYGVFLCLCARAWGFNVFVCIVSELLCVVSQCVFFVVSVRVLRVCVLCVWCIV